MPHLRSGLRCRWAQGRRPGESLVQRKPHSVLREIPRGGRAVLSLHRETEGQQGRWGDPSMNSSSLDGVGGVGARPRSGATAVK